MTQTEDAGTGYSRRAPFHNARLTEVGRGTPMGELMRRYWHAIGTAADAGELPRKVRVLGEDLVLFRDKRARPGLLYERCCHRGTSLFYGRIEDEGIRCCYHGWLFDAQGRCLEQPSEIEGGRHRAASRQPWYPVQERYGLIWAYMGPADKKPLLPSYDAFEELCPGEQLFVDDNNIGTGRLEACAPFNWLQHFENIHDPAHFYWLHYLHSGPQFGARFGEMDLGKLRHSIPQQLSLVRYSLTSRGVSAYRRQALPDGRQLTNVVETVLPTLRVVPNPLGSEGRVDHVGFVLPIDDTHFKIYTVLRAKDRTMFDTFHQRMDERHRTFSVEQQQRFPNDWEAQGSQGPITLHSEEHLVASDKAIMMLRRLYETQMKLVEEGGDPIGVHFESGQEYIRLEAGSFITNPLATS